MIVDSNSIPSSTGHGGYRNSSLNMSFEQKLLNLHMSVSLSASRATLVTAFSFKEFMKFLNNINFENDIITKVNTKHFWTWSKKFVDTSYVAILD
jgi:hypothetical protein